MNEAPIAMVAQHLGQAVSPEAVDQFEAMQRLVTIARRYGNDAGLGCLAGVWLGTGMPEHEIVARLWPQHRARLSVVR